MGTFKTQVKVKENTWGSKGTVIQNTWESDATPGEVCVPYSKYMGKCRGYTPHYYMYIVHSPTSSNCKLTCKMYILHRAITLLYVT